jgi:predicted Fe-Mo cluster-binding NifX family protein
MRIAAACEGANVTEHFGHCTNFNIFDVENGVITKSESILNPGHNPASMPNFCRQRCKCHE